MAPMQNIVFVKDFIYEKNRFSVSFVDVRASNNC